MTVSFKTLFVFLKYFRKIRCHIRGNVNFIWLFHVFLHLCIMSVDLQERTYTRLTHKGVQFLHWVLWLNLTLAIFKLGLGIDIFNTPCEIALRWMPQDFIDN